MLLDLCTGVAFPAFPALLAAEHGVSDLFLPLRYGQVELREELPRRFYCRARWHAGAFDGETQVFDIDFVDRDGRRLGGISEFTVKRAPREALLRGLGGDATRLLYTLGWHESAHRAVTGARPPVRGRHLADRRFRRTGGRGCPPRSRWTRPRTRRHGSRRSPRPPSEGAAGHRHRLAQLPGSPAPAPPTPPPPGWKPAIGSLLGAVQTVLTR